MAVPTRTEAKLWCKIDTDITDDDSLVDDLISAAVDYFEQQSGRVLSSATKTLKLQQFPPDRIIKLPLGPVTSITSVTCRTSTGTSTVSSSDYVTAVGVDETNPLIQFKDTAILPEPDGYVNAVVVTYVCETTTIPAIVKTGLLTLINHWYDNRASNSRDIGEEVGPAINRACQLYMWRKY